MVNLNLSYTDDQWKRIVLALRVSPDKPEPTVQSVEDWLAGHIKAAVLRYETGQLASKAEADKRAKLKAEGW